MNQNRLFVGNLSYKTMENDLQDYFAQAGVVTSVNLMMDKVTGKSRGFAFIEFATPEEASQGGGTVSQQRVSRPRADGERGPAAGRARTAFQQATGRAPARRGFNSTHLAVRRLSVAPGPASVFAKSRGMLHGELVIRV